MDRTLAVRYVPLDSLRPYTRNARTHSAAQIEKLKSSMLEFGWTVPMCVAGSEMIAGHGRLLAAIALRDAGRPIPGNADPALGPVVDLSHLSPTQRRAYVVADNRLALDAGWDNDLLAAELTGLKLDGFDLGVIGFELPELSRLLGPADGQTDPDDVPDAEAVVISRPGDVWQLGQHRLMCGDSTEPRDLDQLMAGKLADLCFTSPPYAQQRDYKSGERVEWNGLMQGVFGRLPVRGSAQLLVNLGLVYRESEWVPYWDGWIEWMRGQGWRRFGWYVWDQGFGLPGDWNGRLAPSHEFIFHLSRVTERPRKTRDKNPENVGTVRNVKGILRDKSGTKQGISSPLTTAQATKIPDSVIRITRHTGGLGKGLGDHPAVFPVALAAEMLNAYSDHGQLAFEPFSGSGSQLVAAEREQRLCYAMEIAPAYVDVGVRRWQAYTGQPARLEQTGQTFTEVGAARAAPPDQAASTMESAGSR